MSIIYEALKKTQQKRTISGEITVQQKQKMSMSTTIILINLLLIICLLAFSKIYSTIFVHKAPLPPPPTPAPVKIVKKQLPAIDKFLLSGMFISKDEKLVIINNKTLHEGDLVDGAKVASILPNKVILLQYGKFFSIKSDLTPD